MIRVEADELMYPLHIILRCGLSATLPLRATGSKHQPSAMKDTTKTAACMHSDPVQGVSFL